MQALKGKNIDLVQRLTLAESKKKKGGGKAKFILPVILLVLLVGGAAGYIWLKLVPEQVIDLAKVNAYINDENNVALLAQSEALARARDMLLTERDDLEAALNAIDSYPEWERKVYNALAAAADETPVVIDSISYDRAGGAVSIQGRGPDAVKSADFAETLRKNELFAALYYYGYGAGDISGEGANEPELIYSFGLHAVIMPPWLDFDLEAWLEQQEPEGGAE